MSSGCGDVLSLVDLQTAKKHQIFEAEVITGKAGGVASGADIDYATNQVTGQVQKTLPAVLRDAGFRPAPFTFATGGTLTVTDADKAVLWPKANGGDGNYYTWRGALPKTIPASSSPDSTGGVADGAWRPVGDDVNWRKVIFSTVSEMTDENMRKVTPQMIDVGDVLVKTQSYHGGWAAQLVPIGGAEYVMTTLQKVRDSKSDQAWEPDGYSDHYLYGGSVYVAMLIHYGVNNIQQFGAKGNNVDNDTPPINAACQKVKENSLPVYAPGAGNFYLMDNDGFQVRVTDLEVDFVLYGDGETTKFKRGNGTATGDFRELFKVSNLPGSKINVTFKDFFIDDNARGSAAPASPYGYQHSHALMVLPTGARGFLNVRFENISAIDAVADICSVGGSSSNYVGDIVVSGIITKDRTRVRSDITVTCPYDSLSVINCVVDKFEVETNSVGSDSLGELKITNVTCRRTFEAQYKSYVTNAEINNLSVGHSFSIEGYNAKISNSHLKLTDPSRLVGTDTLYNSIVFSNTEITINPDFSALYVMNITTAATSPTYVEFNTCRFRNPDNVPLDHFWNDNNSAFEGRVVAFINTDFECESSMQEAASFRSGEYEFINCSFSGAIVKDSYVRQFDATKAITNRVLLDSNNVRESGKYLYEPAVNGSVDITCKNNSAPLPGYIVGLTRYDKIAPPRGIGSVLNFIQVDHFESDGTPVSGRFITGQRCYYKAPIPGGAEGVVVTKSGTVGGGVVFKEFGSVAA